MPLIAISDIPARLGREARLLGLDPGRKTIGVAVGDLARGLATPLKTLRRTKFTADLAELMTIQRDYHTEGWIVGLPLNMDGSEGPRCQSVRDFVAEILIRHPDLPIAFQDERLTTHASERLLIEDRNLRRDRRAEVIDALAAQHILQAVIDSLSR